MFSMVRHNFSVHVGFVLFFFSLTVMRDSGQKMEQGKFCVMGLALRVCFTLRWSGTGTGWDIQHWTGCHLVVPYHLVKDRANDNPSTILVQPRLDANRTAAGVGDIYRHAGIPERSQPPGVSLLHVWCGQYIVFTRLLLDSFVCCVEISWLTTFNPCSDVGARKL